MSLELESIAPYTEEEAMEAIAKLSDNPYVWLISKYLFPDKPIGYLRSLLKNIKNIDDFQQTVMSKAVTWILGNSVSHFSFDGIENVKSIDGKFLAISNHRDIILDPAFTQYVLTINDIPMTEIAVGDNLLANKAVEYMLRSNRMIKVIRGISAKELYLSSQVLSKYIRNTITSGKSSVWIAQRQGRTKNGYDTTEQGLLKMFDMSSSSFEQGFKELNMLPISISYEYEPCDIRKARELMISKTKKYIKKKNEDMHSIIMGIRQQKGNVHLSFRPPLATEEIEMAAKCDRNDRYQWIRHIVDRRIISGYKLWKTNYLCYDTLYHTDKYKAFYTAEDVSAFEKYMQHRMNKVEKSLDRSELREIFLSIYANPVKAKEDLLISQL